MQAVGANGRKREPRVHGHAARAFYAPGWLPERLELLGSGPPAAESNPEAEQCQAETCH
jgi:hypothetical protein